MNSENEDQKEDKLSMGLSVFIALCVVSIFCAISIAIVENIDPVAHTVSNKHINLPNNRESVDFVF